MNPFKTGLHTIVLLFFIFAFNLNAMPALHGGPEPDYSPGVNQPDRFAPARDHADLEGEWNLLVIMVDFEDYPWDFQDDEYFNNEGTPYDTDHFTEMLFSDESFAYPGSVSEYTGSMRDYYTEASRGQFTVTGVVTRWYRAPQPYSYYVGDGYGSGMYPNNSQKLLEDLLELSDEDIDFSDYDNDGDGVVDALAMVHASPGAEEFGRNEIGGRYIWSHKWSIWDGQERDGVIISGYNIQPQTGTIGVFCHEFGHTLGLPDLYDIDNSSVGVGEWALMASGGWNSRPGDPAGSSPAHFTGWSKSQFDWVEVINVEENMQDVEILPVVSDGAVYRLWTDGNADSPEYFLLENRRQIGFDAGLVRRQVENEWPAPEGLLITHIDMRQRGDRNEDNTDETHRLVDVEEASVVWVDGVPIQNLDIAAGGDRRNLYRSNRGDNGDLWPGFSDSSEDSLEWAGERNVDSFGIFSTPSSLSYDGHPSLVEVFDIRLDGENVIASFNVSAPEAPLLYISEMIFSDAEGGNDNGVIEAGESIEISIQLTNAGGLPATAVSSELGYAGDLADLTVEFADYPDIQANEAGNPENPFVVMIHEDAPNMAMLEFSLIIMSNDSLEFIYPVALEMFPEHEWFKYAQNPVLAGGDQDWDKNILSPVILPGGDRLRCWYIGANEQLDPPVFGSVGYAESVDGGLTWERNDQPIITPRDVAWMNADFGGLDILPIPGGGHLMMFTGSSIVDQDTITMVGQASSPDGVHWMIYPEPVITPDGEFILDIMPSQVAVFPYPPNQFGCGFSAITQMGIIIALAFTENAEDWVVNHDLLLPPSGDFERFDAFAIMAPSVRLDMQNEMFEVLYTGFGADFTGRLGILRTNGEMLDYHQGVETGGSVLEPGGEGSWQGEQMIFGGRIFEWQGEQRMLYTGVNNAQSASAVGLASVNRIIADDVAITDGYNALPSQIILDPAFPNPFNSTTSIRYHLKVSGNVRAAILDITGREVTSLSNSHQTAGSHMLSWDSQSGQSGIMPSGIYFVKVNANGYSVQRKLLLMK